MKTTEEIIEQNFTNIFDHNQKVIVKSLMKEYALQACKEQRKICSVEYGYNSNTNDSNNYEINGVGLKKSVMLDIENAPEPELL